MIEFYHIDQHKKQVLAFDMDHTIYNYYPNLHICPFKKKAKDVVETSIVNQNKYLKESCLKSCKRTTNTQIKFLSCFD